LRGDPSLPDPLPQITANWRWGGLSKASDNPPGTSKWNRIEHSLFSFISINWRGKPLTSYQAIINLVAATTASASLKVYAHLDENGYPTKIKVTDAEPAAVNIERHSFHGDWNWPSGSNGAGTYAKRLRLARVSCRRCPAASSWSVVKGRPPLQPGSPLLCGRCEGETGPFRRPAFLATKYLCWWWLRLSGER
jgi:hypothetical protein